MLKRIIEIAKLNIQPLKKHNWVQDIHLKQLDGNTIIISTTDEERVFLNYFDEIKIEDITVHFASYNGKSTAKKIGGATVGGLVGGGAGAIVGALAFGNNKQVTKADYMTIEYLFGESKFKVSVEFENSKYEKLLCLIKD